jgi:hypothetical protein
MHKSVIAEEGAYAVVDAAVNKDVGTNKQRRRDKQAYNVIAEEGAYAVVDAAVNKDVGTNKHTTYTEHYEYIIGWLCK